MRTEQIGLLNILQILCCEHRTNERWGVLVTSDLWKNISYLEELKSGSKDSFCHLNLCLEIKSGGGQGINRAHLLLFPFKIQGLAFLKEMHVALCFLQQF